MTGSANHAQTISLQCDTSGIGAKDRDSRGQPCGRRQPDQWQYERAQPYSLGIGLHRPRATCTHYVTDHGAARIHRSQHKHCHTKYSLLETADTEFIHECVQRHAMPSPETRNTCINMTVLSNHHRCRASSRSPSS